jgi:carbon-monoxide dehydrogenase medium subunit
MTPFKFHRTVSTDAMPALLASCAEPKFIAGGMTLLPAMKLGLIAPSDLIDVTRLRDLQGIKAAGRRLRIGAATTHSMVAESAELLPLCPALSRLARTIGDRHVRNRGTIGGSLANNDPAADYPAAILALDADVCTVSRTIAASAFFRGMFETSLEENELITTVEFTAPEAAAYEKFAHPASGFALAGVFVSRSAGNYRIAVTGASSGGVFRFVSGEELLNSGHPLEAINGLSLGEWELFDDRYGSRLYRENLVRVLLKRAVRRIELD